MFKVTSPTRRPARHSTRSLARRLRAFPAAQSAQGLVEVAYALPVLFLLMAYAIDFGYYFIAAASITSAARDAAQYASGGYQTPGQTNLPPGGPTTSAASVSGEAIANLASFINFSTKTSVQVCSKAIGTSGNLTSCANYGAAGGGTYTPAADPEAPTFLLQRVDVTYTVSPPIPISFFGFSHYGVSLLPSMSFHRQVSMRAMD